jgi:hypothetical protein
VSVTAVRPSGADVRVVGATWAGGGSTSVTTATNDSNLASYAVGTVNSGFAWLNLANTVTLSALRVKTVQLRVQNGQGTAEANYQTGWIRFRDPVTGAVTGHTSLVRQSTTVDQQRGPLVSSGAPGGLAWTQTLLDRVQLEIAWKTSPGGFYLRVHEIYADVDTNTRPTLGTPTVTGATSTTRPDVNIVYTDADSDPQTRLRVKVFSATQYGIAGFNPDSSPFTWDSGDLFGNVDTVTTGVDLISGTTYKWYCKAAQDWAGPEGELWWSTWVASAATAVSITPPPVPTLTVTTDSALPGYRVLLSSVAPINLLTLNQSSLETDTAGWTALSNCTISRSTSYAAHGVASLQMSSTAGGTMTAEMSTRPTVAAGTSYFAKAYVRAAVSARTVRVGIRWFDQAGALISTSFGGTSTDATGSDTVPVCSATAPSNALTAAVVLEVQSTGAGAEIHRWDKIGVWAGGDQLWHIGGSQGTATVSLERLRKVISARGESRNWAHAQLESGGGLTKGIDGFYARTTSLLRSAPIDGAHPAGITSGGARMIIWHPLVGAGNMLDVGLSIGATDDDAPPYLLPAVPGQAMTASLYLRGGTAVNARLQVIAVDVVNSSVNTVLGSTVTLPTSGWTRYTATITPAAGACYARMAVELTSASADLDVFLTGIQWELGSAATPLAPGVGEWIPAWETVRALDSTLPSTPGERYVAFDHEYPPGRPVLYRARTVADTLASNPCDPVAVYMDPPAQPLLKDPFQPENAVVLFRYPDSIARTEDATVYQPLGRDGDPVKVTSWQSGDDGRLHLETVGGVELLRLKQLLKTARPLLLQQHDGGQTYLLLSPAGIEELSPSAPFHAIEAAYFECARPI